MNKFLANFNKNFISSLFTNDTSEDSFHKESKEILVYLREITLNDEKSFRSTCNSRTMQRLVSEVLKGNEVFFDSIIESSDARHNHDISVCFIEIASEFFLDGQINWGRVVTVYALSVTLIKYLKENQRTNEIDDMMNAILYFIVTKLGKWINENGGWKQFCDLFQMKPNLEDQLLRALLITSGVSLGIIVLYLFR